MISKNYVGDDSTVAPMSAGCHNEHSSRGWSAWLRDLGKASDYPQRMAARFALQGPNPPALSYAEGRHRLGARGDGAKVRYILAQRELNMSELARRSGVTRQTI